MLRYFETWHIFYTFVPNKPIVVDELFIRIERFNKMKKIILSEDTFNRLFNVRIDESMHYSDKVLAIKKFLDRNFQRANLESNGDDGLSKFTPICVQLDYNKQPTERTIDAKNLFYKLQYNFKNILPKAERDNFLKQVIKDWYSRKITKNGTLTNYKF